MTARIINLRTHRKRKDRQAAKARADQNAVDHGRTKAERRLTDARNDMDIARLDAHRRDGGPDDAPDT